MTTDKAFKRVVRARMAKTGERYAAARGKIHRGPVLTLGFRNRWQYPSIPGWAGTTLERLGIEPDVHETGGAKGAREALDAWDHAWVKPADECWYRIPDSNR